VSAAAAVALSAHGAAARDWCFNSTSPENPAPPSNPDILVVAQGFKMPKKGRCSAITGFDVGYANQTFPRPATGTACLDSAGAHLHVGIQVMATKGPVPIATDSEIHVHMYVPYPALANGEIYIRRDVPPLSVERTDVLIGPCGFKVPIP
jgi:hypothetical protein